MFRAVFRVVSAVVLGLAAMSVGYCGEARGGEIFVVGEAQVRDGDKFDGDSFFVAGEEVRLLGIDAVESGQFCGGGENGGGRLWRCGEAAKARLAEAVKGREVRCELLFRDAHKRWLSRCSVGGEDLARMMVAGGWALATSREVRALMGEAWGERRGIWGGCFEKPEKWRKGRRKCWHE